MSEREQPLNPYESSTLYEPAQPPDANLLERPIVARGQITWPQRKQAFLLAQGVTLSDLTVTAVLGLVMLLGGAVLLPYAWKIGVGALAIVALVAVWIGVRRQWAIDQAREQHRADGERWVQRTIAQAGITVHGDRDQLLPWHRYSMCRMEPGLVVLVVGACEGFQAFPRHHFASDEEFLEFVRAVLHYVRRV